MKEGFKMYYDGKEKKCSLKFAMCAISGKWKCFIIWYLGAALPNTCRYGELKRCIPWDISHKMFSQQLRELEDDGIVIREEFDEKPLRVEYTLTEAGKMLMPVILYLRDWGMIFGKGFNPDLMLEKSQGLITDDVISYGYESKQLNKSIKIDFKY